MVIVLSSIYFLGANKPFLCCPFCFAAALLPSIDIIWAGSYIVLGRVLVLLVSLLVYIALQQCVCVCVGCCPLAACASVS
jgi:hypothetical protein